MNRHTWIGSERVVFLCILYGAFLLDFLWPIILDGLAQGPPLLAKVDSSAEACGKVDTIYYGVTPPPFLTPRELFCAWVVGKVFDLKN